MSAKKTNIEFLDEFALKQPIIFKTLKILEEYSGSRVPIKVKDEYGVCLITPNDLLRGTLPTIQSAINKTEYCIKRFKEIIGDARYICDLEVKLKNQYKDYKYIPKNPFQGMYECFSELPNLQIPRELL